LIYAIHFDKFSSTAILVVVKDTNIKRIMEILFLSTNLMIRWRLSEIMGRYHIRTKDLAAKLDITASALSHLKNSRKMPRIDGDRLASLVNGINQILEEQGESDRLTPNDLIEWIPANNEAA
jgi:DNA-binding Xre family transcriptional regulator